MADSPLFYTPKVFVDAITAISTYTTSPIGNPPRSFNDPFGLNEVGAPGSDPVTYIYGNDPTWLFQRFARINFTGEPNTLEVRGRNPNPNLYIERLGGGMVDFKAGTRLPNPNEVTPASWDVFQCSWDTQGDGWSCPVSRHHLTSLSTGNCTSDMSPADCQARQVPLYTTQSQIKDDVKFCNANTPYCVFEEDCPQWSAVPDKPLTGWFDGGLLMGADTPSDHIDIQSIGWVQSSNAAKEDLSYDHWNMQGRSVPIVGDLPGFDGTDCANLLTLSGCSILGLCGTGQSLGDAACGGWSDWGFHMRPLAQWVDDPNAAHIRPPDGSIVPPFWNLLGSTASPDNDFHVDSPSVFNNQGSSGDMEIEWEAAWGNNFINAGVPPQPPAPHNTIWSATLVEPPPAPPHEFNWPKVGSLAFVNGRWMLDCGHLVLATPHIYHAEIHPANTLITSEASAAPPAMHILNRVTKAQVWVNQLYEGTPFQTRVWAPPRPSPQSELSALFVNYNGPAGGGTVHNPDGSYTFSLTNYPAGNPATVAPVASTVTAAFTGDGLSVSVAGPNGGPGGSHGIEWQSGQPFYPGDHYANGSGAVGEFIGRWYVGWSCETIKVASQFVYTCAAIP
jgi:hypothetical protein